MPTVGSAFSFTARFAKQSQPAASHTSTATDLRGLRALVVDDNASACAIAVGLLSELGLEAEQVREGEKALSVTGSISRCYSPLSCRRRGRCP